MAQAMRDEPSKETDKAAPAKTERHLAPPWKLKGPSRWARVYVDSSSSMQGFIGDQAGLHFRFLKRLKDILVSANVLNFEATPFGLKILRTDMVSAFLQFGTDRKAYTEKDTYLAGVIEDALSWHQNGVILVLTDGVSSVTKFHGSKEVSPKKDSKKASGDKTESQSARTCSYGLIPHVWLFGFTSISRVAMVSGLSVSVSHSMAHTGLRKAARRLSQGRSWTGSECRIGHFMSGWEGLTSNRDAKLCEA